MFAKNDKPKGTRIHPAYDVRDHEDKSWTKIGAVWMHGMARVAVYSLRP